MARYTNEKCEWERDPAGAWTRLLAIAWVMQLSGIVFVADRVGDAAVQRGMQDMFLSLGLSRMPARWLAGCHCADSYLLSFADGPAKAAGRQPVEEGFF